MSITCSLDALIAVHRDVQNGISAVLMSFVLGFSSSKTGDRKSQEGKKEKGATGGSRAFERYCSDAALLVKSSGTK